MRSNTPRLAAVTRLRRAVELVSVVPDVTGLTGLGIAVTISQAGDKQVRRRVFAHDASPKGLAAALEAVASWIRSMDGDDGSAGS